MLSNGAHLGMMANRVAWDITNAVYANKSLDVTSQENLPRGFTLGDSGTKAYVSGFTNKTIYQYTLSTPYDISSGSYSSKSKSVSAQSNSPYALFFKPDGTKIYVTDNAGSSFQYTLSTAWDISTASYDSKSFSFSTQETAPRNIFIKSDGTALFIIGTSADKVLQYTLSIAWDISTASYDSKSMDTSSEEVLGRGLFMSDDGIKVFIDGQSGDSVFQYTLSIAWDISTGTYDSKSMDVSSETTEASSFFIREDGSTLYLMSENPDKIFQYTL